MSDGRFKKTEWTILAAAVVVAGIWFILFCNRLKEAIWQR